MQPLPSGDVLWVPLRLGMRFLVLSAKVFEANVRIFLCGSQAGMPEQFLDRAQVGPALKQVGREGMAECMCCQPPAGRKIETCSFNQPLHIACIQTASAEADKQRRMTRGVRIS